MGHILGLKDTPENLRYNRDPMYPYPISMENALFSDVPFEKVCNIMKMNNNKCTSFNNADIHEPVTSLRILPYKKRPPFRYTEYKELSQYPIYRNKRHHLGLLKIYKYQAEKAKLEKLYRKYVKKIQDFMKENMNVLYALDAQSYSLSLSDQNIEKKKSKIKEKMIKLHNDITKAASKIEKTKTYLRYFTLNKNIQIKDQISAVNYERALINELEQSVSINNAEINKNEENLRNLNVYKSHVVVTGRRLHKYKKYLHKIISNRNAKPEYEYIKLKWDERDDARLDIYIYTTQIALFTALAIYLAVKIYVVIMKQHKMVFIEKNIDELLGNESELKENEDILVRLVDEWCD